MTCSRRHFLVGVGTATAVACVGASCINAFPEPALLYPAMDLSYFDRPLDHGSGEIALGVTTAISAGKHRQAIDAASALGYSGIHLDSTVLKEYPDPHELKDLLAQHRLTFVALSSGNIALDSRLEAETIEAHVRSARYLLAAGGKYLLIDGATAKGQYFTAIEYRREGRLLTEVGKRVADYGIQTGFHNQMDTIGQTPRQVDRILAAADSRYVKLSLDTAHYLRGGGDAVTAIRIYDKRLLCAHLKNVRPVVAKNDYQATRLGHDRNDSSRMLEALRSVNFRGWSFVGLDKQSSTETTCSSEEMAAMSMDDLTKKRGVQV